MWALIASCACFPMPAKAQAPVYLTQWPAGGVDENTQFSYPVGFTGARRAPR